jgi:hypothetical protein
VNGETPPAFDPAKDTFQVNVSHTATTVTLEGTTAHPEAVVEIYAGKDDSGTVLVKKAHTIKVTQNLELGDNYFYIRITVQGYTVTVYRTSASEAGITAFYFTIGSKRYGVGTGVEAGSGNINGNTITVTVPYGTKLSPPPPHEQSPTQGSRSALIRQR